VILLRLLRAVALAVVPATLAGCASSAVTASPPPPAYAGMALTANTAGLATASATSRAPRFQLGINIYVSVWKGMPFATFAREDIAYIKDKLHANAVSASFPFLVHGLRSNSVYTNSTTPTPAELATLAADARAAGLYFSVRPLLNESSLGKNESRTWWQPPSLSKWFSSYEKFLLPYARMAQKSRIKAFFTGAELEKFAASSDWGRLDKALAKVYKGRLAFANNLNKKDPRAAIVHGIEYTIDAYPQEPSLRDNSSLAAVRAKWESVDRKLPRGSIESEVGIEAVKGAYASPNGYRPNGTFDPTIQVRWFTAACEAIAAEHLGGIYFWDVPFGKSLTTRQTAADPESIVDGQASTAIGSCYRRLGG
jgi:glycosyl hydrolase family 113